MFTSYNGELPVSANSCPDSIGEQENELSTLPEQMALLTDQVAALNVTQISLFLL